MRKTAVLLMAALLSGCAGISDVIKQRESLYGAAPLNVEAPAPAAYALAAASAKKAYADRIAYAQASSSVPEYVDAAIAAANSNCRAYFAVNNKAAQLWQEGQTNIGILAAFMSGGMAAMGVHRDVLTVFGLGSAAWQSYSAAFLANVLVMADYTLQSKVREAMAGRARELRAQAASLTYPAAIDATEEYQTLCTLQAAQALSRSALTAVTTTVAPSGAITVTPITSAFVKDDSGERIINYWAPSNVINDANEARLLAWMRAHGINNNIPFFAGTKLHEAARKQAVADLNIGAAP